MLPAGCRQLRASSSRSPECFTAASDRGYSATHEATSASYPARRDRGANGLLHCPTTSGGRAEHNCEPAPGRYRPPHPHARRGEEPRRLAPHRSLSIVSRAGDAGLFAEAEIAVAGKRHHERSLARFGFTSNTQWLSRNEQFRLSPFDRRFRISLPGKRGGKRDRTLEIAVADQGARDRTQFDRLRETSHRHPRQRAIYLRLGHHRRSVSRGGDGGRFESTARSSRRPNENAGSRFGCEFPRRDEADAGGLRLDVLSATETARTKTGDVASAKRSRFALGSADHARAHSEFLARDGLRRRQNSRYRFRSHAAIGRNQARAHDPHAGNGRHASLLRVHGK